MHRIDITMGADGMPFLFSLLQNGVSIRAEVGCSLEAFLMAVFGVTADYVGRRLQTVLLGGKVVDRLDEATVRDGDTIALSTAMPGLAGAALRSGGHLAAMRGGITHDYPKVTPYLHPGTVSVKLFNVLIRELGLPLLRRGVGVAGPHLAALIENAAGDLSESAAGVTVDGHGMTVEELLVGKQLREISDEGTWRLRIGQGSPMANGQFALI